MTKWRSGVINDPRPDDPQWDTDKEAIEDAFMRSQHDCAVYAVWAPGDSVVFVFYEGEGFRPE